MKTTAGICSTSARYLASTLWGCWPEPNFTTLGWTGPPPDSAPNAGLSKNMVASSRRVASASATVASAPRESKLLPTSHGQLLSDIGLPFMVQYSARDFSLGFACRTSPTRLFVQGCLG